jgi:hypothetical protein
VNKPHLSQPKGTSLSDQSLRYGVDFGLLLGRELDVTLEIIPRSGIRIGQMVSHAHLLPLPLA